jgi:uncharacterized protein
LALLWPGNSSGKANTNSRNVLLSRPPSHRVWFANRPGIYHSNRLMKIPVIVQTVLLLTCSNTFMTFAWYAHLRNWNDKKWYVAALLSWGIAFFEYQFQVPANRIGYTKLSLAQLKILQEVITLSVFLPFALFYMHQPIKLNFLWAGLCLVGAVYFMFRP